MRSIVLVILISSLVAASGCGAIKVAPVQTETTSPVPMVEDKDLGLVYLAPGFGFQGIDVLVVLDPSTSAVFEKRGIDPDAMAIYLKQELVKRLSASGVFAKVTDDRTVLSTSKASTGKILILETSFTELDPGSETLRRLGGVFTGPAGRTKVQVESEIKDPATKQLYFKASNRRVGMFSAFGARSSQSFIIDSLDEIAASHSAFIERIVSEKAGKEMKL